MFLFLFLWIVIFTPILHFPTYYRIYKTSFTLYRLSFLVRNYMENKSDHTCVRSTDIGPQIMEHRPNSKRDPSVDISRVEWPILSLTENYVITRAINQLDGPKYETYSTQVTLLISFISTNGLPSYSLHLALWAMLVLFFPGRIRKLFYIREEKILTIFLGLYIHFKISIMFIGSHDRTVCFHCGGGGLKDWKRTDNSWMQHAAWFPFCVYVRCIKGLNFIRDCQILRQIKETEWLKKMYTFYVE